MSSSESGSPSKAGSRPQIEAIIIRHGQSNANAGLRFDEPFAEIALTPLGEEQASATAASWTFTPSLIVQSPFLRARQTAAPTIARFPQIPVETWAVEEFTFWDRDHWNGSSPEDRLEDVARYWRVGDTTARQGGAETFAEFLMRAEEVFARLETLNVDAPVLIFTHGHFMQALRHTVLFSSWTAAAKMLSFKKFDDVQKVRNVQLVTAKFDGSQWTID